MVSSLAMTRINSLPVSLPKTASAPEPLKQNVILTVRKNGAIYVNKAPAGLDTIGTQLAYEMRNDPQGTVVVNADSGVEYGLVVRVMDRARAIGVRKFALATESEEKKTHE